MRVTYDRQADAAYVYLVDHVAPGEACSQQCVSRDITLDFDKAGKLLGIEILSARRVLRATALLRAERRES